MASIKPIGAELWRITNDYNLLAEDLAMDAGVVKATLQANDSPTWRRVYIKTIFSIVEAQVAFLKRHTKASDSLPADAWEKKKKPFIETAFEAVALFAHSNYFSCNISRESTAYKAFADLVRVRNRITHPKERSDIAISDSELQRCEAAFLKFGELVVDLLRSAHAALVEQAAKIQEELERRRANGEDTTAPR